MWGVCPHGSNGFKGLLVPPWGLRSSYAYARTRYPRTRVTPSVRTRAYARKGAPVWRTGRGRGLSRVRTWGRPVDRGHVPIA